MHRAPSSGYVQSDYYNPEIAPYYSALPSHPAMYTCIPGAQKLQQALHRDSHFDGERYGRNKIDEQRHPEQQHSGAKRPGEASIDGYGTPCQEQYYAEPDGHYRPHQPHLQGHNGLIHLVALVSPAHSQFIQKESRSPKPGVTYL
jgi:hypothetical protein